ncbi:hypothetical protein [Natrinema longum]|uniref:Uncharacterized protein n=1 Tax=Natrinema longum TaxID=370324 RepID=A0A8A2UDE5_9EURY|nr:hypothetical protein [Natrinema longum]MBZ6495823.1 hypothetical protein [Natrinema longum]QSW86235.1 hypothetical protein J0X27_05285 [Natrinema longum]
MTAAESLPGLSKSQPSSGGSGEAGDSEAGDGEATSDSESSKGMRYVAGGFLHAVLGPLLWWWRLPERGERLDDAILINRIWSHLSSTYSIPDNTDSLGVLYHLMSSRVDNIQSPSRAVRMQAIRNFQRGLWIAAWYSTVLVTVAIIMDLIFQPGDQIYPGVVYARPAYYTYWTPVWNLAIVGIVAVVLFWWLFESFEEDYVEYLFVDYAIGIQTPSQELRFSNDDVLQLSGSLTSELTVDSQSLNGLDSKSNSPDTQGSPDNDESPNESQEN